MSLEDIAKRNADQTRLDRMKRVNVAAKKNTIQNGTYLGKAEDGTGIVQVDGQIGATSGHRLISNKSMSEGDRVQVRPSENGLQRVDAKNQERVVPQETENKDILEFYFPVTQYRIFVTPFSDFTTVNTIELEGTVSDVNTFFVDGFTISTSLIGNTFTFQYTSSPSGFYDFIIQYKSNGKYIRILVYGLDARHSNVDGFSTFITMYCSLKSKPLTGLIPTLDYSKSKNFKSEISVDSTLTPYSLDYLSAKYWLESIGSYPTGDLDLTTPTKINFIRYPQAVIFGFPHFLRTSDSVKFKIKTTLAKSKGSVRKNFDTLEIKTILSPQILIYIVQIQTYIGSITPENLVTNITSSGYYVYPDLDQDATSVIPAPYVNDGGNIIDGLGGAINFSGALITRIGFKLGVNIEWSNLRCRYGAIDSEVINIEKTIDSVVDNSTQDYASIRDSGMIFFELGELTDPNFAFSFQFKRQLGSTWFQV